MTPSEATNQATRTEWRNLGFFYEVNELERHWRFIGSRAGLGRFAELLDRYCADPDNSASSEHVHYGPYMYLEVMTWPDAGIDGDSIHGSLDDIARLAQLIRHQLERVRPGDTFRLGKGFAVDCEYDLVLEVKNDGFDPAEADPGLR